MGPLFALLVARLESHRMCDAVAGIPMERGADSVNVACAAAIALYETQRQQRELIR